MHFHCQSRLLVVAFMMGLPFSTCASPAALDVDDICADGQSCGLELLQRRSTKVMSQETVHQVEKQGISAAIQEHQVGDEDVSSVVNHNFSVTDRVENAHGLDSHWHIVPKKVSPFLGHGPVMNSSPQHWKIAPYGHPPFARTLANWVKANASTGIHLYMPTNRHRLAVSDAHGDYVFVGDFTKYSWHSRVHMSEAHTGKMLVEMTRRNEALREIWEIGQWFPICPSQGKYESTRRGDVYPYARLTKRLRMADKDASYDVELYNCNGSLTHLWSIHDEMLPGTEDVMKHVLMVFETANRSAIGVITQPLIEERHNGVNCYVADGEDLLLFAAVSMIFHARMDDYVQNDAQLTMWTVLGFCILGPIFALLVRHCAQKSL